MKYENETKPNEMKYNQIYFLGDVHGQFSELIDLIYELPKNSLIIQVGDLGLGFGQDFRFFTNVHEELTLRESYIKTIRGNHDDPTYWSQQMEQYPQIQLVRDFTIQNINGLNFYFVGGGVSADRSMRIDGKSYWTDEVANFTEYEKPLELIDVLVTHDTPIECFPEGVETPLMKYYSEFDKELVTDIEAHRSNLSKIYKDVNPKYHVYGHYHQSKLTKNEYTGQIHLSLGEFEIYDFEKLVRA